MTDHRAERAALDAAILEHLRIGRGHPRFAKSCYAIASRIHFRNPALVINYRLQALRKAGKIQWESRVIGWVISNG